MTYKNIIAHIFLFIPLVFCCVGCSNHHSKPNSNITKFDSIQLRNELTMIQIDDKYGEWGGDTYMVRIFRNRRTKQLLIDYTEYQGNQGPPPPPKVNSTNEFNRTAGKSIRFERKNILANKMQLELLSCSIEQLINAKMNNDEYISMSGIINLVMLSDSSLYVYDYPSIKWDKFHEMIKNIKNE